MHRRCCRRGCSIGAALTLATIRNGPKCRNFSSADKKGTLQEANVAINIPRAVRPSPRLISKFENRNIFVRLLLELEFLYGAIEKRLPTYLTDNNWMKYAQMTTIIERCCYLHQLYESRKEAEEKDREKIIRSSALNGSCESRPFNTLYYFEREEFRRFAYELFGSRLLAAWRCSDSFPPLLIDCRFLADLNSVTRSALAKQMKDLVLDNSLKRNPFPVVFVNYRTTTDVAQGIVNSWLRRRCLSKYRPLVAERNEKEQNKEAVGDTESSPEGGIACCAAPFIPVVTSATVRECLGDTDPAEIAYINPKAAEYLTGPLSKYKAFVLCASPENKLCSSSFQAAGKEQLKSYRLPITRFVNLGRTPITMPLRITANIIRDVYANGSEWRVAFEKHIPYFSVLAGDIYQNHDSDKSQLQVLERWLSDAERRGKRKRRYFHIYSREERRAVRAAVTSLQNRSCT